MVATRSARQRCLVVGGAGFLGRHLVDQLLASGHYDVTVSDLRASPEPRVRSLIVDIRDAKQVEQALAGMEVVFHVASAPPTGAGATNRQLMHSVNVDGTNNVIAACVAQGVGCLVYTSSASVVFEGRNLDNVDEAAAYAAHPVDYYTETKILGEKAVLAANGRGGLATVALRPSGIFGEGDPLTVPTIVAQARKGKLKFIIGSGRNLFDYTYVGNVAQAHLLAADALREGAGAPAAGRAYFITNGDPRPFWGWMGDLLAGLGYPRPSLRLPWLLLYIVATIFELLIVPLARACGASLSSEFTRNRILLISCNRQFDISAARRDLKYVPKVSVDEALKRTIAHFSHLRAQPADKGKAA